MRRLSPTLCLGLAALALALMAPAGLAQPLPETTTDDKAAPLASSEVSDQEVTSTAVILVALEEHRREAEEKYGDPENMDAERRNEVQRQMMKERQLILQRKTIQEDLDAGRMELIIVSARRDSVLNDRVHAAIAKQKKMKNRQATHDRQ